MDESSTGSTASVKSRFGRHISIAFLAMLLIGLIIVFFQVEVCDEQLSPTGSVVPVCRHLNVTDPPVVVIAVIALGATAVLARFTEISALGVSFKRELGRVKDAAQSAEEAADSARSAADKATLVARLADEVSRSAEEAARHASEAAEVATATAQRAVALGEESTSELEVEHQLSELVEAYDALRRTPRGTSRTSAATNMVAKMIALLNGADAKAVRPERRLIADGLGERLSGYAYCFANPDPLRTQSLVDAILTEEQDHHFGQYWGLRAVRRSVELDPMSMDLNTRRRLEAYMSKLPPGSDRFHEARQILLLADRKQ